MSGPDTLAELSGMNNSFDHPWAPSLRTDISLPNDVAPAGLQAFNPWPEVSTINEQYSIARLLSAVGPSYIQINHENNSIGSNSHHRLVGEKQLDNLVLAWTHYLVKGSVWPDALVPGSGEPVIGQAIAGASHTHFRTLDQTFRAAASTVLIEDVLRRINKRLANTKAWKAADEELDALLSLPSGWDGRNAAPAEKATVDFSKLTLRPWVGIVPAPRFMPGPNGDIWAVWSANGLGIEICFRAPHDISAMLEDARGIVVEFEDDDPTFTLSSTALNELAARTAAEA